MFDRPGGRWALAAFSGVLQVLIFPSPNLYFLSWIALIPLLLAVATPDSEGRLPGRLHSFLLAYFCGAIWYGGSCWWVYHVMNSYGGLSPAVSALLLVAFALYLGLYHAFFGLFLNILARSRALGAFRALALSPLLWVAVEFARAHITSFPWDLLGYAQVENLPLTRIAPFTGVYGLSFVVALVNATIALGFVLPRPRRASVMLAGIAGAIALQSGILAKAPEIPADHAAVLVQGNLPILMADWTADYYDHTIAELVQLSETKPSGPYAELVKAQPRLIVWPESPAPFYTADPKFHHWVMALAMDSGSNVIAGSLGTSQPLGAGQPELFNSAIQVSPQGEFSARYDKIHLVPFGEYIPFAQLITFAHKLTKDVSNFSRGSQRAALPVGGRRVGVFICYESTFPDEIRQFAGAGSELFINISNDGWFGESGAPGQHLNMARMRAIENHRWLLRATNSGITAAVDPLGRVVAALPRNSLAALEAPYSFETDKTFYTRHGDWFAGLCAIIAILALLIAMLTPAARWVAASE
jgi:apolipoprotein N-acyltransferase